MSKGILKVSIIQFEFPINIFLSTCIIFSSAVTVWRLYWLQLLSACRQAGSGYPEAQEIKVDLLFFLNFPKPHW